MINKSVEDPKAGSELHTKKTPKKLTTNKENKEGKKFSSTTLSYPTARRTKKVEQETVRGDYGDKDG